MLEESQNLYAIGDTIVHAYYGVGEVVAIEDKTLNGKTTTYYVVQTPNSTFWMSIKKADNERTRPVASSETIKDRVVEALEADPQEMDAHYQSRQKRMKEAIVSGEIVTIARLIRDLTYREYTKGSLTMLESRNLERIKDRLAAEWASSLGTTKRKASRKIEQILHRHQQEKV